MRAFSSIASVFVALALGGCGRLDNSEVRCLLSDAGPTAPRCDELESVVVSPPALAALVVGRPWSAWLHSDAQGPVLWSAQGLPEGLVLDPATGFVGGIPQAAGSASVTVQAAVASCPDARDSVTFALDVLAGCTGDCGAPPACDAVVSETLLAFVREPVVAPGETLWRDGLFVGTADWPLPPGAGAATHEMTLWNNKSRTEKKVTIDYALPGAVTLAPAEGLTVDLRYIRGRHGDDYLFLTNPADGSLVFASYRGYLSRDEISAECPENADGKRCRLPPFAVVPSTCPEGEPDACGARWVTALEVATIDGKRRLVPGDAAELADGVDTTLIRVADAWERDAWCATPDHPIPYHQAFYQLPVPGACAYFEIRRVDAPEATTAPALPTFSMRVLYPFEPQPTRFTWLAAMEDGGPSELIVQGPRDQPLFQPRLPLVGAYSISLLKPSMTWPEKDKLYPCGLGVTPRLQLQVAPPRKVRIELWWDVGASAIPEMRAGAIAALGQSDRVLALDLGGVFQPVPVMVTASGEGSVKVGVRVYAPNGVWAFEKPVEAGGEPWKVGTLGQMGFTPP